MISTSNNGIFNVYTDLDCLVDVRRSILQRLIGDRDFDKTFPNYRSRKIDRFTKPGLDFTDEDYLKAYEDRNLYDLSGVKETPLMTKLLVMILNIDKLVGKPISINKVILTVNLNHYDGFDESLQQEFRDTLNRAMRFNHEVRFVNIKESSQVPSMFKQYTHVFKYDLLLSKNYKLFFDEIADNPLPNTKFIVPSLFLKENTQLEGTPEDLIFATSIMLAHNLILIPWDVNLYNAV